jgi:lipoprotein LpqH
MYRTATAWAACVALWLGVAGCSSLAPPASPPPGVLSPGTIKLSINGHSAGHLHDLTCTQITSFTTATAGDDDSTVRAVVNETSQLDTVSVQITKLGGFTGSYMSKLQGTAKTRIAGSTFVISGVADGVYSDHPSDQATGDFTIGFAC